MVRTELAALAAVVAATAIGVACSSSDGGTPSGSSSSSSSSGSLTSSPYKQCPPANTPTSCTSTEIDSYDSCLVSKCDAQLQICYGAKYKTGTYGGQCGTYEACVQKCACNDTSCMAACGADPDACVKCEQGFVPCSQGCPLPPCLGGGSTSSSSSSGGPSAGPHTCTELAACCAKITDSNEQAHCNEIAQNGLDAGTDTNCDNAYDLAYAETPNGCD